MLCITDHTPKVLSLGHLGLHTSVTVDMTVHTAENAMHVKGQVQNTLIAKTHLEYKIIQNSYL